MKMKNRDDKLILNTVFRRSLILVSMFMANATFAATIPLLHNDELTNITTTEPLSYYEYEEKLERGSITREIEFETTNAGDAYELEEEIETKNDYNGVDPSYRTNFFSSDETNINVFGKGADFYYTHTLPPAVDPANPEFNRYDFTTDLFEFEFELEGWTTSNPADSTYEVRILMDEIFGVDTNNMLFLETAGYDIASLGVLSFNSTADSEGRYAFEFEFEQYDDFIDGNDIYISSEIYQAITDGILGIHLVRTRGTGNLFLSDSELELEKPAVVPVPPAFVLFASAFLFFWGSSKRFLRKTV